MDPPSKKRRLAPKTDVSPASAPVNLPSAPAVVETPVPARVEFERFARHLQDAAMLIQRSAERPTYTSVSVLLLRWEEDTSVEADLVSLEKVFRDQFHYRTDRNTREDAARLKWHGVRCLFEDAQSDILLFLDTCSVRDAPLTGSHGLKQAIAAWGPEQRVKDHRERTFTSILVESLKKLGSSKDPFTVQTLYESIQALRDAEAASITNGSGKPQPPGQSPIYFTITAGAGAKRSRKDGENADGAYRSLSDRDATMIDSTPTSRVQVTAYSGGRYPPGSGVKDEVEDSAEMKEAAEQLKALSHIRHLTNETPTKPQRSSLPDSAPDRHGDSGVNGSADGARADGHGSEFIVAPKAYRGGAYKAISVCILFAGCDSTFGSKNEWKRHITSQHLCLQYYRCSACPTSIAEGKFNEFNRKDLFTQHLRRMHAPLAIKKSVNPVDTKTQAEWENRVKEMQQSCLVQRRHPPQLSACPKPDCQSVFEGPGSWDEWTEHVGRHMEKNEGQRLGVDHHLAKWALDEAIIERDEKGSISCAPVREASGTAESSGTPARGDSSGGSGPTEGTVKVVSNGTEGDKMDVD
ncbi:unnamed protein product [Parascedosporium putredinis]|uniref:C2H2-type domain-containing protein n=1 Tax=Parascedosporium putredinis TaxID=1442378 RepID=A0A9P1H475_9PEZI|nr:unnamed protein product [Parascedosporium putredinis]CAI7995368.1 unnamed protein product [Parascedosporium putredinis]